MSMSSPFFSIIIPTLNEEKHLPRLLDTLTQQKDFDFEVIVVDATSKDDTKKKALSYAGKLPLSFIETTRANISFQRNLGASKAQGRYLIFIDADSSVSGEFTTLLKKNTESENGLIFIPYITSTDEDRNQYPEVTIIFFVFNILAEWSQHFRWPYSLGGCMVWEKRIFHLVKGFDENTIIGEDHAIIRKAQRWGVRAKFLPSVKVVYSLRRVQREGRLMIWYKFFKSHIYLLFHKEIKEEIFTYEMGGHLYKS